MRTSRGISRTAALLVLSGLVVLLVALVNLRGTAHDSSGAICGSVWHWRASGTVVAGGELPDQARVALSAQCHHDALSRYHRGMTLIWPGLGAFTLGAIGCLGAALLRDRTFVAHA